VVFSFLRDFMSKTSAITNFHKLSINERRRIISDFCDLNEDETKMFEDLNKLSSIGENPVGTFPYVLRFANYFKINNKDYFIPMVIEEASVVAGASYGAKLCYENGIKASVIESEEYSKAIGQIQLIDVKNPEKIKKEILNKKNYLLEKAKQGHRYSKPYDLDVERFDSDLVINLHIDPGDAMGAAVASNMADSIAPELYKISKVEPSRGIISNYSGRLTKAELKVSIEKLARKSKITGKQWSGEKVKENILKWDRWAKKDIKRAVTNNKGIMNDVIGIARATAQDDRAIEAANAVYAIRSGKYQSLSTWYADNDYLFGKLEILIPCGIVGGEIKNYPKAEFLLKRILKLEKADQLAEIMTSVGLAGNLAALSMLSTIGLKEGHQPHRKIF